ncbi:hypothetical protein FAGAP_12110 [Fusarium agapanthi]|uniref:Uncharacterized protein n=1 Tax=Fusarium agapanthi TaxID=1803897 RepID=A0A9P5AZ14_9HYPO|nr:hypothetical protein FAGAP_12110 [Fusarium agapanthi]
MMMELTGSMMLYQPPHLTLRQTELEDEAMNIVQKSHKDTNVLLQLLLNLSNLAAGKSELELGEDSALLKELEAAGPRWKGLVDKLHSMAWVDIVWSAGQDRLQADLATL